MVRMPVGEHDDVDLLESEAGWRQHLREPAALRSGHEAVGTVAGIEQNVFRTGVNVHGDPIAVFYIEPSVDGIDALTLLLRDVREENGALIGKAGEFALLWELWGDRSSLQWAGEALNDLLAFFARRAAMDIDPRIAVSLDAMTRRSGYPVPLARVAAAVGLSASRFQHLFAREVSVPLRRYRAWRRMGAAIGAISSGSNFTTAAHAAGFADQAHFNPDFRRTFGAPLQISLTALRTRPVETLRENP